jgi:hypothetical protein
MGGVPKIFTKVPPGCDRTKAFRSFSRLALLHSMLRRLGCLGVSSLIGKSTATTSLLYRQSLPEFSRACRSYSTDMPPTENVECFISTHSDPFVNLAIEDYLFKTTDPEKYILYLWRNKPCVVVGRNQNPFKECNLQYMEHNNIPLVRRRSGGGTVYHASKIEIQSCISN